MSRIINLKGRGGILPDGAIYIGRPRPDYTGKWGNPFVLRRETDRAAILVQYEEWLKHQDDLLAGRHELRGMTLACWCYPRLCHGEILAEVAEMDDDTIILWKRAPISCLDRFFDDWVDLQRAA